MKDYSASNFFILAFAISWALWLPGAAASLGWINKNSIFPLLGFLGAFGPTTAAIILTFKSGKINGLAQWLRQIFKLKIGAGIYLVSLFTLPAGAVLTIALQTLILGGNINQDSLFLAAKTMIMAFPILFVIGGPLGEELGWRGYALPRLLVKLSPLPATLIMGILHALWHIPLFFTQGTTQRLLTFHLPLIGWFFAGIIALSFFYTRLYQTARSVWPALIFHNMVNLMYLGLTISYISQPEKFNIASINPDLIDIKNYTQAIAIFDLILIAIAFLIAKQWRKAN